MAGWRRAHGRGYVFDIQRRAAGAGLLSAPRDKLFGHNLCRIAMQPSKSFERSLHWLYSDDCNA
ncbi:MAG: hypothetical protein ACREDJ_02550 [Methylocella sp.]